MVVVVDLRAVELRADYAFRSRELKFCRSQNSLSCGQSLLPSPVSNAYLLQAKGTVA